MARKHLLASFADPKQEEVPVATASESRAEYARRGASRSMMQTLDEMAENSMRLLEGEAIVQLDPALLDPSPFADRIGEEADEFDALVAAIKDVGQASPILVRPHPDDAQRYVIVYGHRRAKAARQLGIPVRAVVKPLADIAHVIAQGQENTARANLTFIEKSLFAKKLLRSGISKDDIKRALTIDDTLLSRMLAVVEAVPAPVLDALGAARGVGRDRWEHLKKELLHPAKASAAVELVHTPSFKDAPQEQRFALVLEGIAQAKTRKPVVARPTERDWALAGDSVKVVTKAAGRSFTLALKAKDASDFGAYLSDNLERFYEEYQKNGSKQETH